MHELVEALLRIPEVRALKDVPAGPAEHHPEGSAFEHTRLVIERTGELTNGNPLAMFAAAMHDTGKSKTDPAKWPTHHGHHEQSEKIARAVCERYKFLPHEISFVETVCHYHHSMHQASVMTDKAWRRIFRALGWQEDLVNLFILVCVADHEGRGGQVESYKEEAIARHAYERLVKEPSAQQVKKEVYNTNVDAEMKERLRTMK